MLVVGLYVVYLGGDLFLDAVQGNTDNNPLFLVIGAAFVGCGIAAAFVSWKRMKKADQEMTEGIDEESDSDDTGEMK